ncbi:hypothetical protein GCM10017673_46310 [Streptosporangium violaceochromogenes]|nr:hypothetical protein GCM10017673_46310 [Streptosporangium violaceochromogenes]
MGVFSGKSKKSADEKAAALAEYKAARRALEALPPREEEDDEFLEANSRVIRAETAIPWHRRR